MQFIQNLNNSSEVGSIILYFVIIFICSQAIVRKILSVKNIDFPHSAGFSRRLKEGLPVPTYYRQGS